MPVCKNEDQSTRAASFVLKQMYEMQNPSYRENKVLKRRTRFISMLMLLRTIQVSMVVILHHKHRHHPIARAAIEEERTIYSTLLEEHDDLLALLAQQELVRQSLSNALEYSKHGRFVKIC
jgi:hypothetical protein